MEYPKRPPEDGIKPTKYVSQRGRRGTQRRKDEGKKKKRKEKERAIRPPPEGA